MAAAFHGAEAAVAARDMRALVAMDRAFHRAVALATHNDVLARYLMTLQNIAARYWVFAMERQPQDEQLADIALHRDLARAIAAGDAAAAEAAHGAPDRRPAQPHPRSAPARRRGPRAGLTAFAPVLRTGVGRRALARRTRRRAPAGRPSPLRRRS